MRCKTKQSKTEKTKSVLHAGKHRICTQKMRKSKYIIFLYFFLFIYCIIFIQKIKQSCIILEYTVLCSGQVKCC